MDRYRLFRTAATCALMFLEGKRHQLCRDAALHAVDERLVSARRSSIQAVCLHPRPLPSARRPSARPRCFGKTLRALRWLRSNSGAKLEPTRVQRGQGDEALASRSRSVNAAPASSARRRRCEILFHTPIEPLSIQSFSTHS